MISRVIPKLKTFTVFQTCMVPTLHQSDRIVAVPVRPNSLCRGSVVVFNDDQGQHSIKRIAGLPGEVLSIFHCRVFINGQLLESFRQAVNADNYAPVLIPANHYFLLADDASNTSKDSRVIGPVPFEKIKYEAIAVYWPLRNIGLLTA